MYAGNLVDASYASIRRHIVKAAKAAVIKTATLPLAVLPLNWKHQIDKCWGYYYIILVPSCYIKVLTTFRPFLTYIGRGGGIYIPIHLIKRTFIFPIKGCNQMVCISKFCLLNASTFAVILNVMMTLQSR